MTSEPFGLPPDPEEIEPGEEETATASAVDVPTEDRPVSLQPNPPREKD